MCHSTGCLQQSIKERLSWGCGPSPSSSLSQYHRMSIVSSEHDETWSRVCILSAEQIRTISRIITFTSCQAGIAICARYLWYGNYVLFPWSWKPEQVNWLGGASQAGEEVVHLRVLLKGLGYTPKKPTEISEDNASCIMMSKNLTNRDRSRHVCQGTLPPWLGLRRPCKTCHMCNPY